MVSVVFVLGSSIKKLNDEVDAVQKKLVELDIERDKLSELPKIKEKFMEVKMHSSELEDILFFEKDIVILVKKIEEMAEETENVISISVDNIKEEIKEVKVNKDKKDEEKVGLLDDFSEEEYFKMNISVVGNYSGLLNFINKFNNLDCYNSLVSFNISSHEEENKEDKVIASTNIQSVRFNTSVDSKNDIEETTNKLILESELGIVFYLNNQNKQ